MSDSSGGALAVPDAEALRRRLDLARRLAAEAARLAALRRQEGAVAAELKADQSPVTAVDRELNVRLLEALAAADAGVPIVGEEGSRGGRPTDGWCWFVDPIDGTADYVAGTGEWTVLLGATFGGRPVLGVAARPEPAAAAVLYWAAVGQGAWVEPLAPTGEPAAPVSPVARPRRRLRVSDTAALAAARLLVGKSRHRAGFAERLQAVPHAALLTVGSLSLKAALVAEGRADAYASASLQTSVWDLVGPTVIVEEAGGRVTDLAGRPIEFAAAEPAWQHGVLISNGRLHEALLAALA